MSSELISTFSGISQSSDRVRNRRLAVITVSAFGQWSDYLSKRPDLKVKYICLIFCYIYLHAVMLLQEAIIRPS